MEPGRLTYEVRVRPSVVDMLGSIVVRSLDRIEELITGSLSIRFDETLLDSPCLEIRVGPGRVNVITTTCSREKVKVNFARPTKERN